MKFKSNNSRISGRNDRIEKNLLLYFIGLDGGTLEKIVLVKEEGCIDY